MSAPTIYTAHGPDGRRCVVTGADGHWSWALLDDDGAAVRTGEARDLGDALTTGRVMLRATTVVWTALVDGKLTVLLKGAA